MRKEEARIKRRSAVLAGLLVLVMLLTGTWAWQRFNQRAFNPYVRSHSEEDLGRNFGGRLHNDFKWYDNGTHNKDIYAENFGEEEIFVRIQLREFLTIDGRIVGSDPAISINDPSTWPIYNSDKNDVTERREGTDAALIGAADRIVWRFGGDKIFMPTFNQATHESIGWREGIPAPFNHNTAYRMTNATGNAVDAIAGELDISTVDNVHDVIASGVQTGPGTTVAGGESVGDGGHDDWDEYETFDAPVLRVDENGYLYLTEDTHIAKPTLLPEYGGIMTMEQWLAHEEPRPRGNFWVLDTEHEGGWFYWANPLQRTEATSLLLNEVTINQQSGDLEYIITPMVDFVTRDKIYRLPQLSEDAKDLWDLGGGTPGTPGLGLPAAEEGCAQTETPDNLWTDSTGVEWCVVETSGDYAMLVSRRAHRLPAQDGLTENEANRNHYENEFVPWPATTEDTGGPEIRGRVNTWFNNTENVSPELRYSAVHARLPNLNDTISDEAWEARIDDFEEALSQPVEGSSDGLPFFMSPADINERLGSNPADRIATFPNGNSSWYWLRSAGDTAFWTVSLVDSLDGSWGTTSASDTRDPLGVRLALWVRR